uniref:Hydroxylase n=1 Tax=uncultured Candidatus Entotheonella sp. TaxID=312019 RepID=A0A1L7NR23_9BACT|nr:hydroxylase [uncultured Candidatus Entotheonella sp.]
MNKQPCYLKANLAAEPLVNQWYAWPYLIPPSTAAMYITHAHLKVMQSFMAAPQIHITALKNPAMAGGPFINYDQSRVPEIKALMENTTQKQASLVAFANAIKQLEALLQQDADGMSLEPLYPKVPDLLKGYVELVYDLKCHPSFRFIEGLLYHSPYYTPSSQSVALSLIDQDQRSCVFGTPYLEEKHRRFVNVPFAAEEWDIFFAMKQRPTSIGYAKEVLGIQDDAPLFDTFFTEQPPTPPSQYTGDGVRVRYFGHACLLIETKAVSILVDPLLSYPHESGVERFTAADLPESLDYVLITHNHQDHCMFETLLPLRHRIRNLIVPKSNGGSLIDPSLKLILQQIGFQQVRDIDIMERLDIDNGAIYGLPFLGEHADMDIRTKIAYLITLKGHSLLLAADSNNLEPKLYEHLHDLIGDVEMVFLGMECEGGPLSWLYGPLLTTPLPRKQDQSRRFNGSNSKKAVELINGLNPREVYIYAMGTEPWLTFLTSIHYTEESVPIVESRKVVDYCQEKGIVSERLFGQKEFLLA